VSPVLTRGEVEALFSASTIDTFWNSGIESDDIKAADEYDNQLDYFATAVTSISTNLTNFDNEGADKFF
jgi:hypothetical protein